MTEQLDTVGLSPQMKQERPVIVVDIDGVLFDTPQHAINRWNAAHGTSYSVDDIFDHNAKHNKDRGVGRHYHEKGSEVDGVTGERFDDIFYGAQKDIANYLLMPSAREVLTKLKREYGASVHALTARDKKNLEDVTLTALGEHFGVGKGDENLIDELHFSGDPDFIGETQADKGAILRDKLGANIMVEDSIANAKSSKNAKVATFVLSRAYNQSGHDWPSEETAPDWETLYALIVYSLEKQGFKRIEA